MSDSDLTIAQMRTRLQAEYRRRGNAEATARALQLPVEAVRRVLAGKNLRGENYARFVAALGLHGVADSPQQSASGSAAFHVKPSQSATASQGAAVAGAVLGDGGPVAQLVRQGQQEQAAWVLEFAARLLEAGARQLRAGVEQSAILREVEAAEAAAPPARPPRARRA